MSVTTIHKVKNMQSLVSYCVTPKKAQTSEERVAKLYCDLGSVDFFLDYAENVIKSHARKVQGYSIVQSFPQHEFDVNNEKHIEYVNDMGRKLAYTLYANSPTLVVTHADSMGKCLHNHIITLNHDLDTNKAIYLNRRVKDVRKANDELMSYFHLEVCQPSACPKTQREYWSNKRTGWLDTLKESIDKALSFATSIQEFHDTLLAEGVTPSFFKKNGGLKERFSYKITDTDDNVHTKRSDKLGEQYTRESIEKRLLENKKKKDLDSIIPMDEWIKQQAIKKATTSPKQEESVVQTVERVEIQPPLQYKKVETTDVMEKEKQEEQEMQEKNILEELVNDRVYQELLEERLTILNNIKLIEEKRKNGTDTDEDDNILENLQRKLSVLEFRIDNYSVSTTTTRPKERLNESLMFQHSTVTKDVEFSL